MGSALGAVKDGASGWHLAGRAAVQGTTTAISSVAANKLVGNQASFRWGNVAASALSSAITGDSGVIGQSPMNPITGIVNSGVRYGADKLFGNQASWNFGNVAVDAFGNAIGNSIVSGLSKPPQMFEAEKKGRAKLAAAMQGISDKTDAMTDARIAELAEQTGNAAGLDAANKVPAPTEVSVRDRTRDVSGLNALSAKYSADIAAKTLHGQKTTYRVNQLVAETQHLLGNTTEVTLRNSDGIYGVPELLKRPSNVTTPEQESFLSQVNSSWNKFEKDHPFLSEVLGKSAIIGTGMGIGRDIYSSFPKSSQSLMYGFGNTPKGYGFTGFTNKGYGQLYNLNSGNYISEVKPSLSTNVKLAQLSGSLNSGAKTGGFWGAGFAVAGRTLDYGLDPNKNIISSDFANDVKWDVAKGSVAGIAGGYAGAATTAAVTGLAMSSMAAGATIGTTIPIVGTLIGAGVGFAVGWGVSYLIEDGVYKPLGFRD
ncbi:hypothetical protein PSECIP111951_04188 [Pseudoalteromonas holothuriae]|uniref:Uncharacterized protein n=2 Tax=Pseudoalteromonas holothuriae TaxID=2963714 RepID=A0ABM9GQL3_9GAMM|nr:hypothetical protein PSECIP111951_04188 [Pseudoalteromonas sp. CIP111951]